MNIARKTVIIVGAMTLLLVSCKNDDYGPRKESVPLIEAAAVTPSSFTFGDSITLTATVSDPLTTLTMLSYEVVAGDRTLSITIAIHPPVKQSARQRGDACKPIGNQHVEGRSHTSSNRANGKAAGVRAALPDHGQRRYCHPTPSGKRQQ